MLLSPLYPQAPHNILKLILHISECIPQYPETHPAYFTVHSSQQQHAATVGLPRLQVYASYNYRRDLTTVAKLPGMLSRARSLSREEAESQEADVGKADLGVGVHPPTMRQAIAWELAMRNIRQSEVRHMHMHMQQQH